MKTKRNLQTIIATLTIFTATAIILVLFSNNKAGFDLEENDGSMAGVQDQAAPERIDSSQVEVSDDVVEEPEDTPPEAEVEETEGQEGKIDAKLGYIQGVAKNYYDDQDAQDDPQGAQRNKELVILLEDICGTLIVDRPQIPHSDVTADDLKYFTYSDVIETLNQYNYTVAEVMDAVIDAIEKEAYTGEEAREYFFEHREKHMINLYEEISGQRESNLAYTAAKLPECEREIVQEMLQDQHSVNEQVIENFILQQGWEEEGNEIL